MLSLDHVAGVSAMGGLSACMTVSGGCQVRAYVRFKGVNGHEDFPVGGQVVSLWAVG